MNDNIKYVLIGFMLGIIFAYIFKLNSDNYNYKNFVINKLIRQTARWSLASSQDISPIVSLLHANYGAGFWWALKDIASNNDIQKNIKIDVNLFEKKITEMQDYATKRVTKNCPQFLNNVNNFFAKIAGNN